VMPLDAWLPDETLQAIALENNLSETAFTILDATGEADYELRWFTPGLEIALCGHATLASGHVLIGDRSRIRFRTRKAGILEVARDGDAYAMSLPAYPPAPQPLPHLVAGLGCAAVETLWHKGRYALIVLKDEAQVRALKPDFRVLLDDGDTMTIATAPGETADVVSRVFVPGAGVDEDPVTGSAHSVLVPYWAARLGRSDAMTFFQASARGGHLTGRLEDDRVILGGRCVTVIEGTMRLS
ncbi:MAG TPA: PhzF family phenazine biosynthesis protein, partial [Allosphingosinicella sp.]|nr:PhzF family phenazine biosynthesis protein [Allosphingosinicella sp.]